MELDKKTANGHVGKHMNGSADKQISRRPKAVKRRRSFAGRSISVITRYVSQRVGFLESRTRGTY